VVLANSYGRSPAQIALRWEIQHGIVTIPKSATPSRIASNFDVFDFEITADDMAMIDALDREDGRFGPLPSAMN
jgi:2,5-diketo-D-gluconate reductase A